MVCFISIPIARTPNGDSFACLQLIFNRSMFSINKSPAILEATTSLSDSNHIKCFMELYFPLSWHNIP